MLSERYSVLAQKELKKMDPFIAKKIMEEVDSIKLNPFRFDILRCKDKDYRECVFKVKIGDYCVLYEINLREKIILIHKISK